MYPTVIKTEAQYREYLSDVDNLLDLNPDTSTEEGERLRLLALLIDRYEEERISIPTPNPIDAIIFRMEEQGLQQKDLIPYLGSKARVSEVLSGKRNLSLSMIRSLHKGLGIPASVLIAEEDESATNDDGVDFAAYPLKEMAKKGWFGRLENQRTDTLIDALKNMFNELGGYGVGPAYLRKTVHMGGEVSSNAYKINAWLALVLVHSREYRDGLGAFPEDCKPEHFLKSIAKLSWSEKGPLLASEFLAKNGIVLVFEKHLSGTYLDGAAVLDNDNVPVVALTARYDRLDNFWFTLLHEVAHVLLHLKEKDDVFIDNTESTPDGEKIEREANRFAQEALIPRSVWRRSEAYRRPTKESIIALAKDLNIHPAIIAGRIRKESNNYRRFPDLIGNGEIRTQFGI